MIGGDQETIIRDFQHFVLNETYPCVAARAAMSRQQIACLVADHMACGHQDEHILGFLYDFVTSFRTSTADFHSAAIIFEGPEDVDARSFEKLLWTRLQKLSALDAKKFSYDQRVNPDPSSPDFSFSIGEEAFFIIGMHPASSRPARRFKYPTIVFNPHVQFDEMRKANRYEKLKKIVRRRDIAYSGSVNPMLTDFGERSEVYQYSGNKYDGDWTCPLHIAHGKSENNSSQE